MKEIKLSVDDKNLETVLLILNNLKAGLITKIETVGEELAQTSYKPRNNKVVLEENSSTSDLQGKYISPSSYKKRLQKQK